MATRPSFCRITGCASGVPSALAQQLLCLDHYVEQASLRLQTALELCQQCRPLDPDTIDWLLADADFALQSLAQNGGGRTPVQQARMLELLLSLANLQEYLRHHSVKVKLPD